MRHGQGELRQPPGLGQIDPFENRSHLRQSDLDAAIFGIEKAERPAFQPLVPQGESIAIPLASLDAIASAIAEDDEVSREWILGNLLANELRQAVEALPHIGWIGGQRDAGGG